MMASISGFDQSDLAFKVKKKPKGNGCSVSAVDISEMVNNCIRNSPDNLMDELVIDSTVDDDELDDLVEEQLLVNRIREMQNARRNLEINRIKVLGIDDVPSDGNDFDRNRLVHERNDDENDSLFDFMAESNSYNEERELKQSLNRISKALTLNVLMQSELNRLEIYLGERLKENERKRLEVKYDIKQLKISDNTSGGNSMSCFIKFGMPYFKDEKRFPCGLNSDAIKMKSLDQILSFNNYYSRRWTLKEKHQMEEGVRKHLILENIAQLRVTENKLKEELSSCTCMERLKEIKGNLSSIRIKIDMVKEQGLNYLFSKENLYREFDWLNISKEYLPAHSASECQRMWHIYIKPSINKALWTKEEDLKLIKLADKFNKEDWDSIAKALGTNRTSYQCFVNYQTRLASEIHKFGKWTEEEDDMLASLVDKCRVGKYIPWAKIAYYFQNRSMPQIYNRWTSSLNPDLKKGRFTKQEDRMIVSFVRRFGENFNRISKIMGDRTSVQIRERYLRAVPARYQNIGRWSLAEDKLLVSLVSKHGDKNWSAISKQFVTRTRTQVRQRYSIVSRVIKNNTKFQLENLQRGPMALSQNLSQPVKITSNKADQRGNKSLSELIQDRKQEEAVIKRQNQALVAKIRSGRKKIQKRNELDSKLINYFRETYSSEKLKYKTHYVKPDVDQAVNGMVLFCQFLQAHLVLRKDKIRDINKIPSNSLRNVIQKMQKSCTNWGCNCLHSSSDQFYLCFCHEQNSIDCIPVKAESTLVNKFDYLLSGIDQLNKPITEQKCMCLNNKIKHFIPFYLPPNIISSIVFRSVLLIKDKIATALSYDKKRVGYFIRDDLEIQCIGVKKFTGYFSNEDISSDEEHSNEESSRALSDIPNRNISYNLDVKTSSESLPSTSGLTSVHSLSTSKNNLPAISHQSTDDFEPYRRLTKKDAVNLWKERLMAILGWPIVLANQPPSFSADFDSYYQNKPPIQKRVGRKRKLDNFLAEKGDESKDLSYRFDNITCGLFEDYPSMREFDVSEQENKSHLHSNDNSISHVTKLSTEQVGKCDNVMDVDDCKSNEKCKKGKQNKKSVTKGNSLVVKKVSKFYSKNKTKGYKRK